MAENDVNPPIDNDRVEKKRNEFIDHPSYIDQNLRQYLFLSLDPTPPNVCLFWAENSKRRKFVT